MSAIGDVQCIIPDESFEKIVNTLGTFLSSISLIDKKVAARDFLNTTKSITRAKNLERYTTLYGKKVLEVGSGYGTNLIVWSKHFSIDGYGIEAGSTGYESSLALSRELLAANGLDPQRIINGRGEKLPYPDDCFDIVYSANVLEHTESPRQVLSESMRVLKPGGFLHFEIPNFLSYFEGHYMVAQPPIVWRWVLPFWIRFIFRRDHSFARTLRTEINPRWCRQAVQALSQDFPIQLISLGEERFRERLRNLFQFDTEIVGSRLRGALRIVQMLNWNDLISNLLITIHGYYPIYMTLTKLQLRPAFN